MATDNVAHTEHERPAGAGVPTSGDRRRRLLALVHVRSHRAKAMQKKGLFGEKSIYNSDILCGRNDRTTFNLSSVGWTAWESKPNVVPCSNLDESAGRPSVRGPRGEPEMGPAGRRWGQWERASYATRRHRQTTRHHHQEAGSRPGGKLESAAGEKLATDVQKLAIAMAGKLSRLPPRLQ
ncbi:hypothetical protein SEVIR_5G138850v4 [Setaria viridis]